jgi:hypothetical protein
LVIIWRKLSTIMVRRPPAANTQPLYADQCINMHKGQRPLIGMKSESGNGDVDGPAEGDERCSPDRL